ncbi:aspartate aminotransferase family protein [Martelella alba]|uniref:Aminotransferase class III-fold pyridoxal phosphate-dependent enzyme n=1 Tax=Martelella alba TaxID=2590451 RepID=A0ABY2SFL7_9HYPH|nr:aminotransferase class III-fold pyridoxal phosphate-dependent enzyme [Martelella alba]TKI03502.1 aminotransferase class III-fold pyridoxal phosphate-dependent enzyme [Martelella alba]
MRSDSELLAERRRLLGAGYRLFYQKPLHLVRGEGVWLFDAEGRRYLDAYNNVASVGHCHPRVVAAITRQAATLNTHTRYLHEAIVDYAAELLRTFPDALDNLTLTCSGSEANDLALRIARDITGGHAVIVTRWAYHGTTSAIAGLSPSLGAGLDPGVRLIDAPDGYRRPGVWLESLQQVLAELRVEGTRPAALLLDSLFSSDGVFYPPDGELRRAAEMIRAAGGLFIADEVQAGFGRSGTAFWGFARQQTTPDLVTLGKPMGNGHPVAGVVGKSALFTAFGERQRYFNTFGGNPVSCAAAHAVLTVLREEKLADNAERQGEWLREALRRLARRHAVIGDIRGVGLFIGVELVDPAGDKTPDGALAAAVVNLMRERGVLISATGPRANVLKIRPPLVFAREHGELLIGTLEGVLQDLAR